MKILIVMMVLLFIYQVVKAQTWSEWFLQNHTQLQYLREQIAALQLLNNTHQSCYFATEAGLTVIDTTELADLTEHEEFFESLDIPSEALLRDPRLHEISSLLERCGLLASAIASLDILPNADPGTWAVLCLRTAEEIDKGANELVAGLHDIVAPQQTQMSDAEREQTICTLLESARKLYKRAAYYFQLMTT